MSNVSTIEAKRETFVTGSVVTLKSGGPRMTIIDVAGHMCCCSWHKDDGDTTSVWFPVAALKS